MKYKQKNNFKIFIYGHRIIFFSSQNNTDDYLYLYIRNHENSRLKPFFQTQYSFVFVLACRGYIGTKWIFCCRKLGVKGAYLRFLMYKIH